MSEVTRTEFEKVKEAVFTVQRDLIDLPDRVIAKWTEKRRTDRRQFRADCAKAIIGVTTITASIVGIIVGVMKILGKG